tara:strand:+ start:355 stop:495 length:141 start_codon:yes stop_codon:yes gene_type:complete
MDKSLKKNTTNQLKSCKKVLILPNKKVLISKDSRALHKTNIAFNGP